MDTQSLSAIIELQKSIATGELDVDGAGVDLKPLFETMLATIPMGRAADAGMVEVA